MRLRRQLEQRNMLGGSPTPSVAATAVPVSSPAVTSDSATVIQSQQDFKRQQLKKRGFGSTYLAGDTGGYFPQPTAASPTSVNTAAQTGGGTGPGAKTLGT